MKRTALTATEFQDYFKQLFSTKKMDKLYKFFVSVILLIKFKHDEGMLHYDNFLSNLKVRLLLSLVNLLLCFLP